MGAEAREIDLEPVAVAADYPPPAATIDPRADLGWMRRLWPLVTARRGAFVGALSAGMLALLAQITVPAVLRSGIDAALERRDAALAPYVWILLGLAAARLVFGGIYRYGLFRAAYLVETDLRGLIYERLTRLSFSYYDRTQSGQVISRANSDIRSIQLLLAFGPLVFMSGLTFFVAFAYMMSIHIGLTLVALSTMPGVYFAGIRLRQRVFPLSWVVQARMADVATVVDENIQGVRVVQSFAQEQAQLSTLARAAQRLRWASVETSRARAKWSPLIEALPRLGWAAVLLYGGKLAIDERVSVGTLVAFNSYVIVLQTPFRMLGFLLIQSQRAGASAQRVYEVLDEVESVVDEPGAPPLRAPEGRIEFRNVEFRYRPHLPAVLDDASFTIEPGERVAIVGRTGCGKSTIARLVPRFYDATAGAVLVDGVDLRHYALASVRRHVSVVLDEPFLFSTSLRDNIAFGRPDAPLVDVIAAATAAQAHDFIAAMPDGYDTVVGERGFTLSGGQRQRIAIARSLLVNPKILILDDATSAIDASTEHAIHHALDTLLRDRTTIIIAHRLSTIALADRVLFLEGGRIADQGTHTDLLSRNRAYAEVLARSDDGEDS